MGLPPSILIRKIISLFFRGQATARFQPRFISSSTLSAVACTVVELNAETSTQTNLQAFTQRRFFGYFKRMIMLKVIIQYMSLGTNIWCTY